jgi:Reverse transcriptase (RNA-dependent DNA polymerase)
MGKAINSELEQLMCMGMWQLTAKPANALPIANKWVFIKKFNKSGDLIKYKAPLVAKGCSQRLGQDYNETYSPMVLLQFNVDR